MRTTLQIDDDVLSAARVLARERGLSIGEVISRLARKGLRPTSGQNEHQGFPVFEVREDAPVFGPDEVAEALDEP